MSDHPADVWLARKGRRRTTLPDHYRASTTALMSKALKENYVAQLKLNLARSALFDLFQPDPWDEAVKWIERRHNAKAEWPWPDVVS